MRNPSLPLGERKKRENVFSFAKGMYATLYPSMVIFLLLLLFFLQEHRTILDENKDRQEEKKQNDINLWNDSSFFLGFA